MSKDKKSTAAAAPVHKGKKEGFAFGPENYKLMIIGLIVLFSGYLLMVGGGSDDPAVFNPEIFSFRRITLAPIVILVGFVIVLISIMKKSKS
ncbi:MAG TPA: DUF3098 domain-containing protein [Bacteroidia bacterium]|nr:DUF3098 domain-containing protein [Bacteroidia bacterium]HRH09811.1 DUF3098 domain-containing protein [Bacteroidia bacterium]HRH63532.1 DUF3098 domain-containing protein [Bacteroidia bacterium]